MLNEKIGGLKCPVCGGMVKSQPMRRVWVCNGCNKIVPDSVAVVAESPGWFKCPDDDVLLSVMFYCSCCDRVFDCLGREVRGYRWRRSLWTETKVFFADVYRAARATLGSWGVL